MLNKLTDECHRIDEELRKVIVQKRRRGTRMPPFGGGRGREGEGEAA